MSMQLIDVGHGRKADFLLILLQLVVVSYVCCFFFSFFYDHFNNTKSTLIVCDRHPILLTHADIHEIYSRRY